MSKYFLDTSFIIAYAIDSDSQYKKALKYENILKEDCYINNNILSEIINIVNVKVDYKKAMELYYIAIDNFSILNEYDIDKYNSKTLNVFEKYKGKLSFTDSSIITTMKEYHIDNLISFDTGLKKCNEINVLY